MIVANRTSVIRRKLHRTCARSCKMGSKQYAEYTEAAVCAAKSAGRIVLEAWSKPRNVMHKGDVDLVCYWLTLRSALRLQVMCACAPRCRIVTDCNSVAPPSAMFLLVADGIIVLSCCPHACVAILAHAQACHAVTNPWTYN